jgi:Ca2+-binding RTX toxin-like protein
MSRILPLLLALAAIGLAAPAGALADGTVTLNGNQLVYESQPLTSADLFVTRRSAAFQCGTAPTPCIQIADGQDVFEGVAGNGCVRVVDIVAACDPALFTSIVLKLKDGDDRAFVGAGVEPTTLDGGVDDDQLTSTAGGDTLFGGPGDDSLSDAEDTGVGGDDLIDGGDGADTIRLGSGDDDVRGGAGADSVRMDAGDDTVRLDGLANDGRQGERKNIRSDLETVDGGLGGDTMFGNVSSNVLVGDAGNDLIDGAGGNDVLQGGGGADDLLGGAGRDRATYVGAAAQRVTLDGVRDDGAAGELDNVRADVEDVAAGAGDDELVGSRADNGLDGGAGNDRLIGGGGVDAFSGGPGADAVFARDGLNERVDCGTEADTGEADTNDGLIACEGLAISSDLIADADGDGTPKPADCDDGNAAVRPGVIDVLDNGIDEDCAGGDAVNLDRDADGFLRPTDCDDANPRINPGARDIPGNKLNEDCSGGAAPFPLIGSFPSATFEFPRAFSRVLAVTVRQVRKGSTLRMSCSGRGCPFKSRTRKLKRTRTKVVIDRPLGSAKLRPGTRFELRVTKPATVGAVARFTVRRSVIPARRDLCLPPGAKRPGRCPA